MGQGVTVVLGWDALDHTVATELGLASAFGQHHKPIETIVNPDLEKPHTMELWPTIITGLTPDEHGFRPTTGNTKDTDRASWKDPRLDRVSQIASRFVPKPVRATVGRRLRESGAALQYSDVADYQDRGIETVFDGRRALSLAVPNYRTALDLQLDLEFSREGEIKDFLEIGGDSERGHNTAAPVPELELRLSREMGGKIGLVQAGLGREYDLVFLWIGFLDTIGHLAPVADPGWQARAYQQAAAATGYIESQLEPDDTLVCVSDHGLKDGYHTETAFLGASDGRVLEGVASVLDVRNGIERVTPASPGADADAYPELRLHRRTEAEGARRSRESVRSQLEDLGYLE